MAYQKELTAKLPMFVEAHEQFLEGLASVPEPSCEADCPAASARIALLSKELQAHKLAFGKFFKPIEQFNQQ